MLHVHIQHTCTHTCMQKYSQQVHSYKMISELSYIHMYVMYVLPVCTGMCVPPVHVCMYVSICYVCTGMCVLVLPYVPVCIIYYVYLYSAYPYSTCHWHSSSCPRTSKTCTVRVREITGRDQHDIRVVLQQGTQQLQQFNFLAQR